MRNEESEEKFRPTDGEVRVRPLPNDRGGEKKLRSPVCRMLLGHSGSNRGKGTVEESLLSKTAGNDCNKGGKGTSERDRIRERKRGPLILGEGIEGE